MSEYLAGMTARSEHQQLNQSRQPVMDFNQQNVIYTPGWLEHAAGTLLQVVSSILPSLKTRIHQDAAATRDIPLSENSKAIS